jgi:hypothetical protein
VRAQDPNNLGNIISRDREGDGPISWMVERYQRTIDLGNLGIPHRIGNGFDRFSIKRFYPQTFKHPPSRLPQQIDDLGKLFEV